MKKLKFTVIVIPFIISAVLISGCAQNQNSISDIGISSVAEEKTPEELEQEKKYQEDLKNANAEKENYQYLFGNSDAYQTTMSNIFGSNVVVFIDPEKALEQSFKDYEDAYVCVSEYYHLQKPKSGDLEGIREFANLCYQVYIEDDAALVLDCQYLGRLLYAYRNTYLKADS